MALFLLSPTPLLCVGILFNERRCARHVPSQDSLGFGGDAWVWIVLELM